MTKMCQACWMTPAKTQQRGADGRMRWKCNTCAEKQHPFRAQSKRAALEKKIFSKDTI